MILEGIVTTHNADGSANISPMGPRVELPIARLLLKPYQTSTTYQNLKCHGEGVFHITDDVELLARAAVGTPDPLPELTPAAAVQGSIIASACRWYAFRVVALDDRQQRTEIVCDVVDHGHLRDFLGFNRARHAVIEAAILATRVEFLPREQILSEWDRLAPLVDKTGGPAEHRAFNFLTAWLRERWAR